MVESLASLGSLGSDGVAKSTILRGNTKPDLTSWLLYYKMDEGTGNLMSTGRATGVHNGIPRDLTRLPGITIGRIPTWLYDRRRKLNNLNFNFGGDVTFGNGIFTSNSFTIALMVNFTQLTTCKLISIRDHGSTTSSAIEFGLFAVNGILKIRGFVRRQGSTVGQYVDVTGNTPIQGFVPNRWIMMSLSFEAGQRLLQICINGVSVGTRNVFNYTGNYFTNLNNTPMVMGSVAGIFGGAVDTDTLNGAVEWYGWNDGYTTPAQLLTIYNSTL